MLFTNEEILKNKIKQNARKRVFLTILCFLIILPLIIYNLLLIFELKIIPDKIIDISGIKPYIVTTDNFLPNLHKGDIINLKDENENLKIGDIIIYYNGKEKELAEITDIDNIQLKVNVITNSNDNKISLDNDEILGKYDFKIFDLGLIITFLQDKILLVYFILIIYILYMRNSYKTERNLIRKMKKEIYEKNN